MLLAGICVLTELCVCVCVCELDRPRVTDRSLVFCLHATHTQAETNRQCKQHKIHVAVLGGSPHVFARFIVTTQTHI